MDNDERIRAFVRGVKAKSGSKDHETRNEKQRDAQMQLHGRKMHARAVYNRKY